MPKLRVYPCLILTAASLLISGLLNAQVTPPAAYPANVKVNYVRTWVATAPEQNPVALITRPLRDVKQTTVYIDGLGRPIQSVTKQGALTTGSSPVDLVSPIVYDAFGREEYKYLPFAANGTGGNSSVNDGNFKLNAFQQQATFSITQYPGETYYYGRYQFEASPLNRIEKEYFPGNSWVGSNRGAEAKNWLNTNIDDVKIWKVTNNPTGLASYATVGVYGEGTLFKQVKIDEAGNQIIIFVDKEGNVILKKIQLNAVADNGTGKGYTGFLNTYYIYDDFNKLRCVIQPQGVELISSNWMLTDETILAEQCFRYEYDDRHRMVVKKMPGDGEVHMIYDARDRQVFVQDANMRASHQWMATLYDALNRPVLTGIITYQGNRNQLQSLVSAQTTGINGNIPVTSDLTLTTITSGSYYATNSITLDDGFESITDSDFSGELIEGNAVSDEIPTIIEGVAVNRSPLPVGLILDPLTINYYDNYQWANSLNSNLKNFDLTGISSNFLTASNSTYPYAQSVTKTEATTGLTTGSRIRILGTTPAQYITVVNFFDEEGNVVQSRSQNSTGGYDVVTTQYTWSNKPLIMVQKQEKAAPNVNIHTLISQTEYDDLGRILSIKKSINSVINGTVYNKPQQEISRNEYDALGQLKKKDIGTGTEQLEYDYNIRGFLLGINRNFIRDASQRYFGFELGYDKAATIIDGTTYSTPQFTGNISGTIWKSAGDNEKRKFDYSYDATYRLTGADFNQFSEGSFTKPNGLNFSILNLSYDVNGNILTMQRYGWKIGQPNALIDNLQYTYFDKSNKLKNVIDAVNDVNTNLGDFRSSQLYISTLGTPKNSSAIDYNYDGNGNLTKDLNKDIGTSTSNGIEYNVLNLPRTVVVRNSNGEKGTISYIYDAGGNKHKKIVKEPGKPAKTILYLGGAVYENDTLQHFANEEGRLRFSKHFFSNGDSAWEFNYDYYLKDNLGNTRMVLTEQKDTVKYAATMESAYRTKEELLFSNINSTLHPTPGFYPLDVNVTNPNDYVSHVNGTTGKKMGPAIVLKVMSGDQLDLFVKSYYKSATKGQNNLPIEEVVSGIANSLLGTFGSGKGTFSELTDVNSPLTSGLNLFRSQKQNDYPDKPKAYLNWILFDEQFNYVATSSGASGVASPDQLQSHVSGTINISKNGFLYIYTSNETENWSVYFNDLIVEHRKGKILEETHYYPYGLSMAAISSKSFGRLENRYKFNGKEKQEKEFSDDSGLEWYDFGARMYDVQIGRWMTLDPLSEKMRRHSPYNFSFDNPIRFIDPDGMGPQDIVLGNNIMEKRKLNKSEIQDIMKALQDQTDDKLKYDEKTGKVTIASKGKGNKKHGTDIIRRVIGHSKTLTINSMLSKDKNGKLLPSGAGAKTGVNESIKDANGDPKYDVRNESNGIGTDTEMDLGNPHSIYTENSNGKVEKQLLSLADLISHEIIHALADMNGEGIADGTSKIQYKDDKGNWKEESVPREEKNTVLSSRGASKKMPGYTYPTENDLRAERGKAKRTNYTGD